MPLTSRLVVALAAVSAALAILNAAPPPDSAGLTFHVPFDGTAEPAVAAGAREYYPDELRYDYGISGLAMVPQGRGYCRYRCDGNLDPTAGTFSLWVRPLDWTGAEAGAAVFVDIEGEGKMLLGKGNTAHEGLVFSIRPANGEGTRVQADISDWMPGQWHQVTACWAPTAISLYCDGRLSGKAERAAADQVRAEYFHVGRTRWHRAGATALDEVRVYRTALRAEDIARRYTAEVKRFAASRTFAVGVETLPLTLSQDQMSIQVGDARLYQLKGVDTFSGPVCLELTTRIHRRACSQYYALDVLINGKRMSPFLGNSRSTTRLLNKPFFYTYTGGGEGTWFGENWVVYYGQDWDDALSISTASAEEPDQLHRYVFDITDLVRPDQTNTLVLRNCAYTVRNATHGSDCPLVVKDMAVRHFQPEERKYRAAFHYPDAGTVTPTSYARTDFRGQVLPTGAISVSCGSAQYTVESVYSYPGGIGNGFHADNRLTPEAAWAVQVNDAGRTVTGQGSHYRIERTVRVEANHIAVCDRIINTGSDAIGMVIKNTVRTDALVLDTFLCGNRNITRAGQLSADQDGDAEGATQEFEAGFASYNPTYFVRTAAGGVGIGVFDDVVRIQAKVFAEPGVGGVYTDRFALGAGRTYDLTWIIVPVKSGGYYQFINTVREIEDLNAFQVESTAVGKWYMARWEESRLKKWLDDRNLTYLILGPQVPGMDDKSRHGPPFIDHAAEVIPDYRELVRKVHKVRPQTKVLVYISTLHCVDESDYAERFKEALKIGANGKPVRYARQYFCLHVDGTDSYSNALREYVDFCLDTIGLDGLFWDVMACERARDIDYSRWDGHSALLDPEYRIKQKISIQGIEGIPFFVELIERIYAKRKVLVVDYFSGAKTVFAALRKHGVIGTMEGNNLGKNLVRMHLHTPLSMRGGEDPTDMDRCFGQIVQNIRNNLRHGCLYAFYGPWVDMKHSIAADHIYPITPVELHPGYIIGRNKIVTTRPGRYGWPASESADLRVHRYNPFGEQVRTRTAPVRDGDMLLVDLPLAPDELAVIERVPSGENSADARRSTTP